MTSTILFDGLMSPSIHQYGDELGVHTVFSQGWGRARLDSDPVGLVSITVQGVQPNSEIKFIDYQKNVLAGAELSGADPVFTVSRYVVGSPNNVIRILIIALGYEVIDFTYTLPQTNSTIPVFQRIDRNYRNPQ